MPDKKPEIKLIKWMPVAVWSLDRKVEVCAICRNHIMDTCVECQTNLTLEKIDCPVTWGKCEHAFHAHCISQWLLTKNVCPLDTKPWETEKCNK
ncbi:ring-box 1 protein [Tubulinosema ratisbonensis]|uniref:Ring-box 1 protein n=1 Tax=Tubulinosema ratisbonensis TaxID=291195 RepID=A0A437AQE6_9MICR|nr:ring-box 1 protein [Tubulinosema ratisbonensis]RVD93414.1 ring-box 1 protein [Tubulinosema ratisbonensis]